MIARRMYIVLAAAVLGLVGCGGSSHRSTTVAQVTSTTSGAAAPITTAATISTAKRPADKRPKPSTHHIPAQDTPQARASQPITVPAKDTTPTAGIPRSAHVSGPTPIDCLKSLGMLQAHATENDSWEALDPTNKAPLFVDGPYRSPSEAKASARSLDVVELSAQGSIYVVTATLVSHLNFQVNAVAKCLDAASGHGPLRF